MFNHHPGSGSARTALLATLVTLAVALLTPATLTARDAPAGDTYQLFLVRHAEKQASGDDPALSEVGNRRAAALARLLQDAGIQAVWSSDFRRTRQTAWPLAQALGQDIRLYDPHQLGALADQLVKLRQTALVVGHSNTTPELARMLGGEGHGEMDDATEYDRLYILTVAGGQLVSTTLLRYSAK